MGIVKTIDHLDLNQVAGSGQCFRWKKTDNDTYVIPGLRRGNGFTEALQIRKTDDGFELSCSESDWISHWREYFDMSTDYVDIERRIMESADQHAITAYKEGSGIRILRQDLWEIIVSFIISQNNNIKRITNSIELICEKNGGDFPYPGDVSDDFFRDKTLGLGYRDTYLKDIYEFALDNPDWTNELSSMEYSDAFASLKERNGIGPKVANCICLFGLHHISAFPIDTHVKQLLEKYYPNGFDYARYEGVAGAVQQYLFYYELVHK